MTTSRGSCGSEKTHQQSGVSILYKKRETNYAIVILQLLLKANANPNAADCKGDTPLHYL